MITDEENEKWNDKVKAIQQACKNAQIGLFSDFLEVVPHDAATTLTSTEGFVFRSDGTVVKAELDSQECKRGLLQAKYVYLTLRLQSFESVLSISKQLERDDLMILIREIDEVAKA